MAFTEKSKGIISERKRESNLFTSFDMSSMGEVPIASLASLTNKVSSFMQAKEKEEGKVQN